MKFRAIEIPNKPLIVWEQWDGELDALTVNESNIPANQFGVCPWKVEGGSLVARTTAEMAIFETEYNQYQAGKEYIAKTNDVNAATFTWNGFTFPMHETARLYYTVIEREPGNYKAKDITGALREVLTANNAAFIDAYYYQLKQLTQP